jgi:hypothetical protein
VNAALPAALRNLRVDVQLVVLLNESFGFLAHCHVNDFNGIADDSAGRFSPLAPVGVFLAVPLGWRPAFGPTGRMARLEARFPG